MYAGDRDIDAAVAELAAALPAPLQALARVAFDYRWCWAADGAATFAAIDAGPDLDRLGQGPLYRWANFDQIGTAADPLFQDTAGAVTYTEMKREVSDIRSAM